MASKPVRTLGRVLFWRYRRGSWQYDILCALILAFIFLTPKEVFQGTFFSDSKTEEALKQANEDVSVPTEEGTPPQQALSDTDETGP